MGVFVIKKIKITVLLIVLVICLLISGCAKSNSKGLNPNNVKLDSKNPTNISIWHYYNGAQQDAFNRSVDKFNATVGKEKGIVVQGFSQGNVSDLENSVLDSLNQKPGAKEIPNIFAAYSDTAFEVDNMGFAIDITPYLAKEEIANFIDSYIEEGIFSGDSSIKIFPVAKSTEIFALNKTDWDKFATATKTSIDEIATIEGITAVSKKYFEWTDSLTEMPNDGKAFFGRDAMANYLLVGAKQLGVELISVNNKVPTLNFNKDVIKKLWDNYYIPYINGYFSSLSRFRSDDVKTNNIISFVGSSSGATFFPDKVILNDTENYPIEMQVFECPRFENAESIAVQQGAGMVVTKTSDVEIYASIEFLKWFTTPENNIDFSISSGYLPVQKQANNFEMIKSHIENQSDKTLSIISAALNTVNNNTLYTTKAFSNGTKIRNILEYSMTDIAIADRKTVVNNIKSGMTHRDAVSNFTSNEYFDIWYQNTLGELQNKIK